MRRTLHIDIIENRLSAMFLFGFFRVNSDLLANIFIPTKTHFVSS